MSSDLMIAETGSLPPREARVSRKALGWALVVPPVVWFLQTVAGFALVTNGCSQPGGKGTFLAEGWDWLWSGIIIMNLIAIALACAATAWAALLWRRTRSEARSPEGSMLHIEHGSNRFLASWGVLGGAWFFVLGTIFTTIIIFLVPLCAN